MGYDGENPRRRSFPMQKIFSLDSPIIQFLARIGDLIILNFLFLLTMIPVFTGGAGLTAMFAVVQSMVYDKDRGVLKPFFRAFRENFKSVTPVWLLFVVMIAALVGDFWFLYTMNIDTIWFVAAAVLAVLVLGAKCYLFPLMARYENSTGTHLRNAFLLTISNLPRTLYMIFLELVPLWLLLLNPKYFYYALLFWPLLGFSGVAYIESALPLKKTFDPLEKEIS